MVEAQVAIGVMGHPSRATWVRELTDSVADLAVIDHRRLGENYTGNQVWRALGASSAEWAIVLQDDAIPILGFREEAAKALGHIHQDVGAVSFYVGTGHPITVQPGLMQALTRADEKKLAWLHAPDLYWGVAVAMRTIDIHEYLKWSDKDDRPYDLRIGAHYKRRGRPILYSHPSLVDHRDGVSLVRPDRKKPQPRHAHRFGVPESWATAPERIPPFPTRA